MAKTKNSQTLRTTSLLLAAFLISLPAFGEYSGGTGEAGDPYQIATAADLMALGGTPADYDKHFVLAADIDLDPNLPGGKVFDRALIAPDIDAAQVGFQGPSFTGVFDGGGHTISHLTMVGEDHLGLFGLLTSGAQVKNLGMTDVSIISSGGCVGALVSYNLQSVVTRCYSTGLVTGDMSVGGLVGINVEGSIAVSHSTATVHARHGAGGLMGGNSGAITRSYAAGAVSGTSVIGGLVGDSTGIITASYSSGVVRGEWDVGGLVGQLLGSVAASYSTSAVSGDDKIGGLVGLEWGNLSQCYSAGAVSGKSQVGGLAGSRMDPCAVTDCFWDIETSGQTTSACGIGKTTAEMQTAGAFLNARWDLVAETANGTCDYWQMAPGEYPQLRYLAGDDPVMPEGSGTAEQPYLIRNARDLGTVWCRPVAHYRLAASVDLSGIAWSMAVVPWLGGTFDGNGYAIRNLHIRGNGYLGLFGESGPRATIANLGLEVAQVSGAGSIGAVVGRSGGAITGCRSAGVVTGTGSAAIGGLAGTNEGSIAVSQTAGRVSGTGNSTTVGGLVGYNLGSIAASYSTSEVSGDGMVGGLVGHLAVGSVSQCFSAGAVSGSYAGGLVGGRDDGVLANCFWDTEASGQAQSASGIGKTTAEMQTAGTFLNAGWDFVGETRNGTCDYWQTAPGEYPQLRYFPGAGPVMPEGLGTAEQPYLIRDARDLGTVWSQPTAHYRLAASVDLAGITWSMAVVPWLSGTFDGNDCVIRNLHIHGGGYLGLFGESCPDAVISRLALEAARVDGDGARLGALAGVSRGTIADCRSTGVVTGAYARVGGLVGHNLGSIAASQSTGAVAGHKDVGGLVGWNDEFACIATSHSTGSVNGVAHIGGLVGRNVGGIASCCSTSAVCGRHDVGGLLGVTGGYQELTNCYSLSAVRGEEYVGGLAGYVGSGTVSRCYSASAVAGRENVGGLVGSVYTEDGSIIKVVDCFWDTEAGGRTTSGGGLGKTTTEMQTANTFLEAGWDFVDETANGTEDIWWIEEGRDYPRLWWETAGETSRP